MGGNCSRFHGLSHGPCLALRQNTAPTGTPCLGNCSQHERGHCRFNNAGSGQGKPSPLNPKILSPTPNIGALRIRIGFGVCSTIIVIRNPQNPSLIIKAPTPNPKPSSRSHSALSFQAYISNPQKPQARQSTSPRPPKPYIQTSPTRRDQGGTPKPSCGAVHGQVMGRKLTLRVHGVAQGRAGLGLQNLSTSPPPISRNESKATIATRMVATATLCRLSGYAPKKRHEYY